ncbi:hypothetical protein AXX12_11240 [Anaerosporomusa subterranea]|uniref:Uncharacterized protein n=1 Tax=Anaerosporomusa subterranea TaxID=1794912 RepID=A0A154BP33_ANASB|nr:hypothetical protein AXX12_11240 [Anaerosporomusa subterranea]
MHGLTAAGSIITISVAANSVGEQGLKSKFNKAGGCMYQLLLLANTRSDLKVKRPAKISP